MAAGPFFALWQRSTHDGSSPERGAVANRQTPPKSLKDKSEVGIYLNVVTLDSNGSVWLGGSVWLLQALLVHNDGQQATAVTLPYAATITDLVFAGHGAGWMIANNKSLYQTTDGGVNWDKALTARTSLTTLCFSDVKHGWVAGRDGVIYRTTDGGVSWHKQISGTELDLQNIQFVDSLHGWGIGGKAQLPYLKWASVLIATTNGGRTWKTIKPFPELRAISFIDRQRGWGITLNQIYHTIDGGETWTIQHKGIPLSLSSVSFLSEREGWVVGAEVLHTDNGGETWSRLNDSDLPTPFQRVVFADSSHGWAIGSGLGTDFFRTNDGGKTWAEVPDSWKDEVVAKVRRAKFGQEGPRR